MINCPDCKSTKIVKYGRTHNGKQRYRCHQCHRQFVLNPTKKYISNETKELIDKLLLERISLAGIARATGVSETWLQKYVNHQAVYTAQIMDVNAPKKFQLILECDELWSFVGRKDHQQWLWIALEKLTRKVVAAVVGDRSRTSAQKLWNRIPVEYQKKAIFYTDFWEPYVDVIPKNLHRAVGKETGKTAHIERFNNTLRQRVSRLVRKSLSFSKKLMNHVAAIFKFLHHYNQSLLV